MVCSESGVRYKSRPDYEMGLLQNLKLDFKLLSGVVYVPFGSSGMYVFLSRRGRVWPYRRFATFKSRL